MHLAPFYLRPPRALSGLLSPSLTPSDPLDQSNSPRALHPPPWPEPSRRTSVKFMPTRAPPLHLMASEHLHHHHAYLPRFISSSPRLQRHAPTSRSPPSAAGDAPLASRHPSRRGAPRRVRHALLNPPVCRASPEVACATGAHARKRSALPPLPRLCSRAGGGGRTRHVGPARQRHSGAGP